MNYVAIGVWLFFVLCVWSVWDMMQYNSWTHSFHKGRDIVEGIILLLASCWIVGTVFK